MGFITYMETVLYCILNFLFWNREKLTLPQTIFVQVDHQQMDFPSSNLSSFAEQYWEGPFDEVVNPF